jgi:hypothetical protein
LLKSSVAACAMAGALAMLPTKSLPIGIAAGVAVYSLVLLALGAIEFRRGRLPALRV